jgi:hypothetical protein
MKIQTNWETVFIIHMYDKRLISKRYKEFLQLITVIKSTIITRQNLETDT